MEEVKRYFNRKFENSRISYKNLERSLEEAVFQQKKKIRDNLFKVL